MSRIFSLKSRVTNSIVRENQNLNNYLQPVGIGGNARGVSSGSGNGAKGDTGDQGPQGIKGDTGDQGAQGLNGDTGVQGIQGIKGDTGVQGPQGIKGDTGDQGIQGAQGPQGLTGDQGPQGIKGDTGDQGPQGIKGDTGDQGAQGLKGDTGDQGIQGAQGLKGDTGDQGAQGLNGDTGVQGIQGVKGDTGDQGVQGVKGDTGDQGVQGVKGDTGDQGTSVLDASGVLTGHIIPDTNAVYDLGSAEYKIRHLFLSDNTMYIGEKHSVGVDAGGDLKFRKRKTSALPASIASIGGASVQGAIDFVDGANELSDLTTAQLIAYAQSLGNSTLTEQDLFNVNDYEDNTKIIKPNTLLDQVIAALTNVNSNPQPLAVITLTPGIWILNANLGLTSTTAANELRGLTLSMGVGAAVINPEVCIQRTSDTPIYTLSTGNEIYENLSTTLEVTENTDVHLMVQATSTTPLQTTPSCKFTARRI